MELTQKKRDVPVTFRDEMCQQPKVLRRFVKEAFAEEGFAKALTALMKGKENPHVVFTGMGSSLFVCYIAMNILLDRGIMASAIESYELNAKDNSFFKENMILVAVSQSGESPEVIELLEKLPKTVPVIGITNYPKSRLYTMAPMAGQIYAGTEYLTSTKSYTNSVAALLLLAYRMAGYSQEEIRSLCDRMAACADKMEKILEREEDGDKLAAFMKDIQFLVFVASGHSYTTACHSELVAEEAGKFHSSCFTPAQFIHGPIELIYQNFGTVVYDFDGKYSGKCDDVRASVLAYGGKVLVITNREDIQDHENQMVYYIDHKDPETALLLDVLPLELAVDSLCKSRGEAAGNITRVVKRMAE